MLGKSLINNLCRFLKPNVFTSGTFFHTSSANSLKWLELNEKIYPPQEPGEPPRPAYICHCKENVKYSPKKLWYIACLVRGMTVDEAVKQLQFINKKGAVIVQQAILEAQSLAVKEHNVEFKSNLWVSESFVGRGLIIKGLKRHARGRMSVIRYRYSHYFLTLEEGKPPKDYYYFRKEKSGEEMLAEWLNKYRNRSVLQSL
ncbi:mitochondrial 50S ribosomal protein L22, putative [Pediculus humanus corporis]|uniref:Large ribosomal subunit protein uL22m n=1 Tax=Pediculus humanus subsp. corporis TaxID=121224 RepID=E0VY13_PEDHC|nr:mitochondrial 50S ribosomal protein L22, putative [Pediculus humanus corporis]EEB18269.1 mitochondrial 50S ribosomal protein L22, putative [Pediculus humanus corporis]